MRVVFAGTPDFAVPSLLALLSHSRVEVVGVYTQPDRPAGRGKKLQASAVKQTAIKQQVPVFQPASFRVPESVSGLKSLEPDLMVVVAYGLLLPEAVLSIPRLGCVNLHGSLLPRWRGAAPIQRAIEAGDAVTGITLMQMDRGLDTGAMLAKQEAPISDRDTGQTLHDTLSQIGGELLSDSLDAIFDQALEAASQDETQATYAPKLSKQEAVIDWHKSATEIGRKVRALFPWPIATTVMDGLTLRVLEAALPDLLEPGHSLNPSTAAPGQVIATDGRRITVQTGGGALHLLRLQKSGGKPMAVLDFLNGVKILPGSHFD